jgi:hypothetical protein
MRADAETSGRLFPTRVRLFAAVSDSFRREAIASKRENA